MLSLKICLFCKKKFKWISKKKYKDRTDKYVLIEIQLFEKTCLKEDYSRTRASDSKHLPALTHSNFLVNILCLCLIFTLSTKKLGFTIVLYEKNFEMLSIF